MKKYADRKANLLYPKHKTLKDVLIVALNKSLIYEKALKEKVVN